METEHQAEQDLDETQDAATDTETTDDATGETHSADAEQTGDETDTATEDTATEDDDEVVITIGDEKPESEDDENDSSTIRKVRLAHREEQRKVRELQQQIAAITEQKKATELGAKPTLESCDYDTDKFEADLDAWKERKRLADAQLADKAKAEETQRQANQARLDSYAKRKAELNVKGYQDAEDAFTSSTTKEQQGLVLHGADDPAAIVAALGKYPKKLAELAAIKDPVKFCFAVAKLENQLKVTTRKTPPLAEKSVSGSASTSGTAESQLERLRADAAKTGDLSKVLAYNKQQRKKQA